MIAIIFQTTKFLFSTTQTKSGFFFFANAHNSWLQSLTKISCNHTLAQLFFSFFCSHRNKPAVFAMTHFSFLQSLTTQAFQTTRFSFFNHTDKVRFLFLQTHIIPSCNHSRKLVAITHWFSFIFLFLQLSK
jgi:hypothetical protein